MVEDTEGEGEIRVEWRKGRRYRVLEGGKEGKG
jgi:hypothetical protein